MSRSTDCSRYPARSCRSGRGGAIRGEGDPSRSTDFASASTGQLPFERGDVTASEVVALARRSQVPGVEEQRVGHIEVGGVDVVRDRSPVGAVGDDPAAPGVPGEDAKTDLPPTGEAVATVPNRFVCMYER